MALVGKGAHADGTMARRFAARASPRGGSARALRARPRGRAAGSRATRLGRDVRQVHPRARSGPRGRRGARRTPRGRGTSRVAAGARWRPCAATWSTCVRSGARRLPRRSARWTPTTSKQRAAAVARQVRRERPATSCCGARWPRASPSADRDAAARARRARHALRAGATARTAHRGQEAPIRRRTRRAVRRPARLMSSRALGRGAAAARALARSAGICSPKSARRPPNSDRRCSAAACSRWPTGSSVNAGNSTRRCASGTPALAEAAYRARRQLVVAAPRGPAVDEQGLSRRRSAGRATSAAGRPLAAGTRNEPS